MSDRILALLQKRIKEIDEFNDKSSFQQWKDVTLDTLETIYGKDSNKVKRVAALRYNISGQSTTGKGFWADSDYIPSGAGNEKALQVHARKLLLSYIDGVESFGVEELNAPKITENDNKEVKPFNLTVNISQYQNTDIKIDVILSSLKDKLSNKELSEIQDILDNVPAKEKKSKIIEKLMSFGSDVASNILASILTNPQMSGN